MSKIDKYLGEAKKGKGKSDTYTGPSGKMLIKQLESLNDSLGTTGNRIMEILNNDGKLEQAIGFPGMYHSNFFLTLVKAQDILKKEIKFIKKEM